MRLDLASVLRARVSAVALLLGACGGGDGPVGGNPVASVRLTTSAPRITVGATATVSVEALSANGTRIAAVTPGWTIAPTSVASFVGTPGATATIRGERVGTVTVRAAVHGLFGDVTIQVDAPVVARVEITAPPSIVVGQTVQLTARTLDVNDSVLTDRVLRWSTTDPSLVRIDSVTGLAVGLGAGNAQIRARSEGVTGTTVMVVGWPSLGALRQITAGLPDSCRRACAAHRDGSRYAAAVSPAAALIAAGSTPSRAQNPSYALGRISLGLISLRPPQKTLV